MADPSPVPKHARRANGPSGATEEQSLGELLKHLSEQTTELARKEVELAKAEMAIKGKRLGLGAGAFGAAGLIALFAFGALTATAILALAEAFDAWLAALIVTVVYAATAGVLALVGRSRVEAGTPPVPERAVETTKEDVEVAKRSAREARA
jgi:Putative Actinobacterial Holin-X, holin superfamily III